MKSTLYLHCGMYKTGSSFLQTMFVRNRDLLKKNGLHYPKSEKELDMFEGRITAGNGIHLSRTLIKKESDVIELLSKDLNDAKKMNMNSVLYSSENLFNCFAKKDDFEKFCRAAKTAGYNEIRALIYFRDPISHALSTYKHRAKNGDHRDFSRWLHKKYEIFEQFQDFIEYSKTAQIQWTCRMYKPDSIYMVQSSFVDWLGMEAPEIPDDDRVNASLNLNELRVLQSLKKTFPGCEDFLREAFLSLQTADKESEKRIKDEYSVLVAEKWCNHQSLLSSINSYMRENEKLTIKAVSNSIPDSPFTTLSEKQVQAFAHGMNNYLESKNLSFKINDLWVRGKNKVRRKWKASKISSHF